MTKVQLYGATAAASVVELERCLLLKLAFGSECFGRPCDTGCLKTRSFEQSALF